MRVYENQAEQLETEAKPEPCRITAFVESKQGSWLGVLRRPGGEIMAK